MLSKFFFFLINQRCFFNLLVPATRFKYETKQKQENIIISHLESLSIYNIHKRFTKWVNVYNQIQGNIYVSEVFQALYKLMFTTKYKGNIYVS